MRRVKILTATIRDRAASTRYGYCPRCTRWTHLDSDWGCRHCRASYAGPWQDARRAGA